MRLLLAFLLLAAPAAAQNDDDLVERIDACIGLVGAPGEHPEYCMGIYAEPCLDIGENQTTLGMVQCIATETAAWDEILNREYRELMSRLDQEQQAAMRDLQRKWIAFRDADCAFPHIFVRGTLAQPWGADCMMQHTARRAVELRGYIDYMEY